MLLPALNGSLMLRPCKTASPASENGCSRTEFVIIGTRDQLTKVTIDTLQVGETATTPASEGKDLGSWFDRYPKNGYPHKQHM